ILKKYGMETCDPIGTPMAIKDKLDLDQNRTLVNATRYQSMIGALMHLMSSRLDIVHTTCLCVWYQAKPTKEHLKEDFETPLRVLSVELNSQLPDYGFHFNKIPIYYDSKSAIAISGNPIQHSRTRYIAIRYHLIKEHVEKDRFNYLVCRLGMRSLSPQEHKRLAKS
nr:hypothetical protein [Tanacetum cinerariifolium]